MKRTTVYLPNDLKAALSARAIAEQRSEAELIREAIAERVLRGRGPRPRLPISDTVLDDPCASERVDELLRGFGAD